MKQLHPIQLQILKKLLFTQSLRYTDLKPEVEMENNKFDFHLDQMIKIGYVSKDLQHYTLSSVGKEYACRLDTEQITIIKQAKLSVILCCVRVKDGKNEYLIYTRLKQPFYGCQGFMSGKILYGESSEEAAQRELFEETNLTGSPKLIAIRHVRVFDKNNNDLLEDKFFFFYLVKNPHGKLKCNNEGKEEWIKEDQLSSYITNHFESYTAFQQDLRLIKNFKNEVTYEEVKHISDKF